MLELEYQFTLPIFYQDSSEPETQEEREKREQEWRDHMEVIL